MCSTFPFHVCHGVAVGILGGTLYLLHLFCIDESYHLSKQSRAASYRAYNPDTLIDFWNIAMVVVMQTRACSWKTRRRRRRHASHADARFVAR